MGWDAVGRRRLTGASAWLAISALACAVTPEEPAPAIAEMPHTVLLAPLSFNQRIPERLEPGVEMLTREILAQLEQQQIRVSAPAFQEFHDAWLLGGRDVDSLFDEKGEFVPARFDEVARNLVAAWRERGEDFDVLLMPYLGFRAGTVVGQSVQWDGVARRLPLEFEHGDVQHLDARRRFQAPCTSLRVLAFGRDGARLFERYGGLEVSARVRIESGRWRWEPRDDLFQNRGDLEEGARIALHPLLGD